MESEVDQVFNHWNQSQIIVHKGLNDKLKKAIKDAIKSEGLQEIKDNISRYARVIHEPKRFFFAYRWTLYEFLTRKNAMIKFSHDHCFDNFLREDAKKVQEAKAIHVPSSGVKLPICVQCKKPWNSDCFALGHEKGVLM